MAVGGRLDPEWLLDAYSHGIFPWPFDEELLAWWSPDPRAIIEFANLHVSRSLAKTIRRERYRVSLDENFAGVIAACATTGDRLHNTWLTPQMQAAYLQLHQLGHAHSVEAWAGDQLVGGVYGVALGGMFAAESMFHLQRDASKVALIYLVRHLERQGFQLLDIQQLTPHTASLGATEIPRHTFLRRIKAAIQVAPPMPASLPTSWEVLQVTAHDSDS